MNARRILHTLFIGLLAIWTLAGCIDDELVKNNNVVEGVPITVTMNLSGKATSDVTVNTRAGSDLSELSALTLYIYDGGGNYQNTVTVSTMDGTLKLEEPSPSDRNNVRYSVTFQTTSGTKKLLAVGNPGASWWGTSVTTELDAPSLSFEQLKQQLMTLAYNKNSDGEIPTPITITASDQMLISGWNEGIVFDTGGNVTNWGNSTNPVAVQMKRSMAEVTFNIEGNGMFTPTSYKVYNVPTKAYVANMDDSNIAESVVFNHFASSPVQTSETGTPYFRFYMPENIYNLVDGVGTDYQNRDRWDATTEEGYPLGKKWTYAPKTATFVVISGTYSGTAEVDGVQKDVTANVEYTVHLGDFSTEGSVGDFSVKRNVSYTYNVSVEGVDNIVVEALIDDEKQPGAEGQVFDYTGTTYTYNLDAHYEQVYLEYNLTSIANNVRTALANISGTPSDEQIDNAIADELILIIRSEAMDYTETDPDGSKGYTVQDKRGTLRPYKIYADAVRGNIEPDDAKSDVLDGSGNGVTPTKGIDYKWVEFWPQREQTLASYPGVSDWSKDDVGDLVNKNVYGGTPSDNDNDYLMDVYDVIVAMGKVVKKIYKGEELVNTSDHGEDGITVVNSSGEYVARFTAFVNEYYYYHHPLTGMKVDVWSVLTDKIPREMIIAMDTHTSSDGNSSYSKLYTYISQLSMTTIYNSRNESINGFGIETYNETPLTNGIASWGTPYTPRYNPYTLDDYDGRGNQKKMLGLTSGAPGRNQWDNYINAENNGWTATNSTDHVKHKLGNDAYANTYRGAYAACLSRNRDLNGNGTIDDNEVRWYLASLNEYIRMGIGESVLGDAKLYFGTKSTMTHSAYPDDYINQGALYFTSSETNKRVFWAVEKGAYGGNSNYVLPIRCVRLLPADVEGQQDISSLTRQDGTDIKSSSSFEKVGNYGLKFSDRLVDGLYRGRTDARLERHSEDAEANKFFEGIQVAQNYLSDSYSLGQIIQASGYIAANPCTSYHEGGFTWRVPNLVELSAMNAAGLLRDKPGEVACCTYFSNTSVRVGFAYSSLIYCPGDDTKTATGAAAIIEALNTKFHIRCVRDVSAAELGSN